MFAHVQILKDRHTAGLCGKLRMTFSGIVPGTSNNAHVGVDQVSSIDIFPSTSKSIDPLKIISEFHRKADSHRTDKHEQRVNAAIQEISRAKHQASTESTCSPEDENVQPDIEDSPHEDWKSSFHAPPGSYDAACGKPVNPVSRVKTKHDEPHYSLNAGAYVKSVIFGGLDGIITTFAIVSAVEGGGLSQKTALLMGIANLVADALSMGVGDYLSESAEQAYVMREQAREIWETENYLEGEIAEMVEIYVQKGMLEEHAKEYIRILALYPKVFVESMMVDELGLMPITDETDKFECHKKGAVTFLSFLVFGLVPLGTYLIAWELLDDDHVLGDEHDKGDGGQTARFAIATMATLVTLFVLGLLRAKLVGGSGFQGGLSMMVTGSLAAGAAYSVGWICGEM
ncbi:unnamed protein product [Prorocentrum cordatum]|uniref:Uncharacterized protein n=1 Tax=Prorocentrum cordatum TaxID=2364126 RepID=A0ABN9RSM4_9DINO|nr:unnamed protein product [Polarella glacialis]